MGRAGDFSGKGPSRVLAGGPVSHGPGPQGGRVNGKVLVLGAVAKSSVIRKKLSSDTLDRRGSLHGPPFRCWGLKGVQFHCGRLGTRKRCRLDTPPFQSPRGGGVVRQPRRGQEGERGRCSGSASQGSGTWPSPTWGGGTPSPTRACEDPPRVSGGGQRPADARGWGWGVRGRGRGGEEKSHNKTCVAERTALLEWKEPAPAERSGDSGGRVSPGGRGAARGRSRYWARAAGWAEGSGLSQGSGLGLPA